MNNDYSNCKLFCDVVREEVEVGDSFFKNLWNILKNVGKFVFKVVVVVGVIVLKIFF